MKRRIPIRTVAMTVEEYEDHVESFNGICLSCGEIHFGDFEGDARDRQCDSCGLKKAFGIEEALLMGAINIKE